MKNSIFLAMALVLFPSIGIAQDRITAQSSELEVSIEGPAWSDNAETSIQDGVGQSGNPVTLLNMVPKGQSFDNWQELFGVMIEEDSDIDLAVYQDQQIGVFKGACELNPSHVYTFKTDPHYTLFIVPCRNYKNSPQTGELAIFFITSVGVHRIKIYQHFRGPAFDPLDATQWPSSSEAIDRFLNNITRLQVSTR